MKWLVAIAIGLAGCQFSVQGVASDSPAAPPSPDLGSMPPTVEAPDLSTMPAAPAPMPMPMPMPKPGPMPMPSGGALGAPCDASHPCLTPLQCVTSIGHGADAVSFPGGYCTASCATLPCPSGSACANVAGEQWCMAGCASSACRIGYTCCDTTEPQSCLPGGSCG